MATCCDEEDGSPLERIAAGLDTLPRQLRTFAEARRDVLARLGQHPALAHWRPHGNDYGLMWLEMWAYVADVLSFYDARVADGSYVRTAFDRTAVRRVVALLGYTPTGGIAGTADVAVLAKGKVGIELPGGTAFRSRGFGAEAPQVFESTLPTAVHPLKNQWTVEPFTRRPTIDATTELADTSGKKGKASGSTPLVRHLLFEPTGFGLATESLVLFESRDPQTPDAVDPKVTRVQSTEPFEGKDGRTYMRATFEPPLTIPPDFDLSMLRVRRPVQTVVSTANEPVGEAKVTELPVENVSTPAGTTRVYLDGAPRGFRLDDPVIVARDLSGTDPVYAPTTVRRVLPAAVKITSIPVTSGDSPPKMPATELSLEPAFGSTLGTDPTRLTFHHTFVDAGRVTNVGRTQIGPDELTAPEGVPVAGIHTPPPEAEATAQTQGLTQSSDTIGVLEQAFLFSDAADRGGRLDGRLSFFADGRASFVALVPSQLPPEPLRLPLTLFGNVVATTRGERVTTEVLGHGNAAEANQRFVLKKKNLTYLHEPSSEGDTTAKSTLEIRVDGIRWREVPSFFGCGPGDRVYVVRHDDAQATTVMFGNGVRGSRLSSGVQNVVASYRFGAGSAAPPAKAITQLASAPRDIQGVRSPAAAKPGRDPESAETLRTDAPRRALLLGRAVSVTDFETLAAAAPGVVKATAQWLWIDAQMQAGVVVHYIGESDEVLVVETLRLQSDPTVPLAVTRATPIPATASFEVEVDPRYVKTQVAADVVARLREPPNGVLSLWQASIGGAFWASPVFEAIAQVEGVVAVGGAVFTTVGGPTITTVGGTCIATGQYLDFTAPDAIVVTGVDVTGAAPPLPGHGGEA